MRSIISSIPALERAILRTAAYIRSHSQDEEATQVLRKISKELGAGNETICYNELKIPVGDVSQVAQDRLKTAAKEEGKIGLKVKSGFAVISELYR